MTYENVFYEVQNNLLYRRKIKVTPTRKVQEKERLGEIATCITMNQGDVYLSKNEDRYLQIVERDDEKNQLAYRMYESNTTKLGFVSKRVYTSLQRFQSDLCNNRFELF